MRRIHKKSEPDHLLNWKRDFKNTHGTDPTYDDLNHSSEYDRVRKELLEEQGYICCYCEKAIGRNPGVKDCNIEHFMPRHPDPRILTPNQCRRCKQAELDYDNMFASCLGEAQYSLDHCNHKKDNWFDFQTCISPASPDISGIFGFRMNGKIFAIDSNRSGEEMKKQLNLDTYILQEQRKAAYDAVIEMEFDEDELLEDDEYIQQTIDLYQSSDERGMLTPFCSMIVYCLQEYVL